MGWVQLCGEHLNKQMHIYVVHIILCVKQTPSL